MDKFELINLELRLESLLKSHDQLRHENTALRQKLVKLTQERAELLATNNKTAVKIKRIISQLRSEMQ
jgi:uncharacterized protein (TIGR02449 family)